MRAPRRAGRLVTARCRKQLSPRELSLLTSLKRYRYLSARQIEELHFSGHASPLSAARTCRRVLERLTNAGVLWRLGRRIGGVYAGSASYVYTLAPLGQRLLDDGAGGRVRRREPALALLEHTLAIAALGIELQRAARAGELELMSLETEPHCWRRFSAGLEGSQTLEPDLALSLRAGAYEYHWFVEIDLATHGAAAIVRKCRVYQRYWQAGIEQDGKGLFPKVLFVAPHEPRRTLLARTIAGAQRLNAGLFAVTTSADAFAALTGAES
jgi:hypothetical protein